MANKADGEVLIVSKIDNSKAQKQLDELQKNIVDTEREIEKLSAEQKKTEEKGVFKQAELEKEKALLADMRKDLAEMRSVAADTSFSDSVRAETRAQIPIKQNEIAEQARKVSALQKELNKINSESRKYAANLDRAKKLLERQETKAGELAQQLISAKRNVNGISTATQQAQKRMDRLSRRVKELVKSALIFSVITKGLTELKEWSVNVLKANEEARKSVGRLKAALLTLAQPLVNVLIPAAVKLFDILTAAVVVLARITAAIMGTTAEEAEKNAEALNKETEAIEGVGEAAKKTAKQLASFDEINKLSDSSSSGLANTIIPDFDSLDFDLSHVSQELEELVVDIEAKIENIKFDWENGNIAQNKDAWITALTGLLGAVIGASFAGLPGGLIGLLLGLSAGIVGCTFFDKLENTEQAKGQFVVILGAILGALIGAKFGGLWGAAIGLLLGTLITLVGAEFAMGKNGDWDSKDTLTVVLGGILGAVIGFAFGGFDGAAITFLIGALFTFMEIKFSEGNYNKDAAIAELRTAIFAILGALLGVWAGGPVGAAVGVVIGVVFSLFANTFDEQLGRSTREKTGKALEAVLESILGVVINSTLGQKVFGGLFGSVIKLVFGVLIDFDDIAIGGGGKAKLGSGAGRSGKTSTYSEYNIPALAQGAVVPPNREFLALLGDNKTENEIVSPVSAMKQAFKEAAQEMGGFGNGELRLKVSAGKGFARYLKFELDAENTRQGERLVTNERLYT